MKRLLCYFISTAALAGATAAAQAPPLEWNVAANSLPINIQMHGLCYATYDGDTYLYNMGGNSYPNLGDTNRIYYSKLDSDGQPGPWALASKTLAAPATSNAYNERLTFNKDGKIYQVGGSTNGSGSRTDYQVLTIGPGGDVANVAAVPLSGSYAAYKFGDSVAFNAEKNMVYVGDTKNKKIHYATVGNGTIGAFTAATVTAAAARVVGGFVLYNGYLYWIGGGTSTSALASTEYFSLDSNGIPVSGATATANLPDTLIDVAAFVYKGELYCGAGCLFSNDNTQSAIYKATVDSATGNITAWTLDSNMKKSVRRVPVCVVNDEYIYLTGGRTAQSGYYAGVQIGKAPEVTPVTQAIPANVATDITVSLGGSRSITMSVSANAPGTVEVKKIQGSFFNPPDTFKHQEYLYPEAVVITNTGLGTFTASLDWELDAAKIPATGIDKAFRVDSTTGEILETLNATVSGGRAMINGISGFSTWYLGTTTAVPVTMSGFELE